MEETVMLIDEFQLGLVLSELEKPTHITFSTYDIDLTLFMAEFYDPDITYDIWYWLSNKPRELPDNVHLHQLNNLHCKFWYVETKHQARLVVTSCNITYQMVHGCIQSYYSATCNKSSSSSEVNKVCSSPNRPSCSHFFDIFNLDLEETLLRSLNDRLLYNIPNKWNAIEKWYMAQKRLFIDANNTNLAYLDALPRTVHIRSEIPPSVSTIVCYYRLDHSSPNLSLETETYTALFHYKLYASDSAILLSSNNFSFHHKTNYELGILIPRN